MKSLSKVLALAMMLTLLLGLTAQASSTTTNTRPSSATSETSQAYASGVSATEDGVAVTAVSESVRNEAQAYAV